MQREEGLNQFLSLLWPTNHKGGMTMFNLNNLTFVDYLVETNVYRKKRVTPKKQAPFQV